MSKKFVIDMLESFFHVLVFVYLNELVTHSMLVTVESKIIFKYTIEKLVKIWALVMEF